MSMFRNYAINNFDADSQNEGGGGAGSDSDSDSDGNDPNEKRELPEDLPETPFIPLFEEEFGESGEQIEELAEENKSLIWCLVKQVRPGMDLSKVVLPTFILEPRSFLDKLSDSYYHANILSKAALEDDPFTRMKLIVKWYLSGFYKKPKGLKKPYNPILGETFRCYWEHPNESRTFYIAEQVSHHPPVSAFYVTNRQDGFSISCSILAKSKFYGNSTSAVLEGIATLTLLPRGESYTMTTPYAHCKGILMGTLSMEYGGKINIDCENTGYKTELEFKLKPFLGGNDSTNAIGGKIKLGKETLATLGGRWDVEMFIKDSKTGEESRLFIADKDTRKTRLIRYVVPLANQLPNESEKLWNLVSDAIKRDDQIGATEEKTVLEEAQRNAAKERKATYTEWLPAHFHQDIITGQWIYNHADLRPWDPRNDVKQYETSYKVLTKTRHLAPMVRTQSMISSDALHLMRAEKRQSQKQKKKKIIQIDADADADQPSDSSQSDDAIKAAISNKSIQRLAVAIDQVNKALDNHTHQLQKIHAKVERLQYAPPATSTYSMMRATSTSMTDYFPSLSYGVSQTAVLKAVLFGFIAIIVALCLKWLLKLSEPPYRTATIPYKNLPCCIRPANQALRNRGFRDF